MRAALAPHGSLAGGDQWRNSRCERGSKNRTGRNVGCRRVGTMVATSCASWRAARPGAFSLCSLSHTNVESGRNLRGMVRGILKLNVNLLPLLGPRESDRCGAECISISCRRRCPCHGIRKYAANQQSPFIDGHGTAVLRDAFMSQPACVG